MEPFPQFCSLGSGTGFLHLFAKILVRPAEWGLPWCECRDPKREYGLGERPGGEGVAADQEAKETQQQEVAHPPTQPRTTPRLKPKLAGEKGAIGTIIYSDPADDGYGAGDVYPKGPFKNESGVQRGSVMDMPLSESLMR